MLKRLFFIVALLGFVETSRAQTIGCYVEKSDLDFYGAGFLCGLANIHPTCSDSHFQNLIWHGQSIAETCDDYNSVVSSFNQLLTENSTWIAAYNLCNYNLTSSQQQVNVQFQNSLYNSDKAEEWKAYAGYLQNLEQRLRKKCGSKCKKIR